MNITAFLFALGTIVGWGFVGVLLRSVRAERPLDNYSWYAYISFALIIVCEAIRGFPVFTGFQWNPLMLAIALTWTLAGIVSIYASEAAPTKIPLLTALCGLFPVVTALGIFVLFHDLLRAKAAIGIVSAPLAVWLIFRDSARQSGGAAPRGLPLRALVYVTCAVLGWGAVGIMLRAAQARDPFESFVWYALVNVATVIVMDCARGFTFIRRMRWDGRRMAFGAVWAAGSLCYVLATFLAPGAVSQITAIAGIYPVLTSVLIATIFRDRLTWSQWAGVCLATIAVALVSLF